MKILEGMFKVIKFILKALFSIAFLVIFFGLIGYILYTVNIIIGVIFMIILALVSGFFAVKIKVRLDKKKMESNIDVKIEKQKFNLKTKDTNKLMTTEELNENLQEELRKKEIEEKKQVLEDRRLELENEMADIKNQIGDSLHFNQPNEVKTTRKYVKAKATKKKVGRGKR